MVRPIGSKYWTCRSCGWKHVTAGSSDVVVPWVDIVLHCPECGSKDFDIKDIPGVLAPLASTYARVMNPVDKTKRD